MLLNIKKIRRTRLKNVFRNSWWIRTLISQTILEILNLYLPQKAPVSANGSGGPKVVFLSFSFGLTSVVCQVKILLLSNYCILWTLLWFNKPKTFISPKSGPFVILSFLPSFPLHLTYLGRIIVIFSTVLWVFFCGRLSFCYFCLF